QRTILVDKRTQLARRIEARGKTRSMQGHEGGKREGRRRGGERMFAQQRRETEGFAGEIGAHRRLGGCAVIAFVEKQIERAMHGGKARGEIARVGDVEKLLRSREKFL